ncbi:hypothetical protein JCM14469_37290 [Desulfatiferula olefinivorans]
MMRPLTAADHDRLLPFFEPQVHRLCYYSLSAFICWSHHVSHPVYTERDGMLLIGMRYAENPQHDYLYLPLARGRALAPDLLRDLARDLRFSRYRFVPGDYVASTDASELSRCFTVNEDPDLSDYIYTARDLADLKGNRYAKKRNLIHQFLKSHVDEKRVTLHAMTEGDIPGCLAFLDHWSRDRDIDPTADTWAAMEWKASENAVRTIGRLGYTGLVLKIDGEIRAFGIGSRLTAQLGGFHFEKADPQIKGLYQYFDQQCARRLFDGLPLINKECDMGETGLRQSKRSYHPVEMVTAWEMAIK